MNPRHLARWLPACLLLSACGTTFPWQGSSLMREPERSRLATQFANSAKMATRCDKVDSLTSRVVKTQPAARGQQPLAPEDAMPGSSSPGGSPGSSRVTERWVLSLCGRQIEAEVYHALDPAGHLVTALRPL